MAEFQELIKNFDRIRDYMRQFYIYGFKVRKDFQDKSPRTYDNERRRIESWLSEFTKSDYTAKGKHVYINVDCKTISQNPLYAAWKSKSFTDNDLLLHFFLLDQLHVTPQGMTAGRLCDEISGAYGVVFDSQTVRLKLKEYEDLGILWSEKQGRSLLYRLSPTLPAEKQEIPESAGAPEDIKLSVVPGQGYCENLWLHLMEAVEFFQGTAPFGFIGSSILDREDAQNELFQFKHQFIVHTLEDKILAEALKAIREHRMITYQNRSSRSNKVTTATCLPLKVFVSARTGRRYLCVYLPGSRRFNNARLDSILKMELLQPCEDFEKMRRNLEKNLAHCWGVSFGDGRSRREEICIKLFIDEEKEPYVINRLHREGRGGEVMRIRPNEYLYTGSFFDTNELLSWVKSFTGRILDIQGANQFSVGKITRDWETMYQMYCSGDADNREEEKEEDGDGTI